jgi:hypothetical protein
MPDAKSIKKKEADKRLLVCFSGGVEFSLGHVLTKGLYLNPISNPGSVADSG